MKRPKIDYDTFHMSSFEDDTRDLEKYCDMIETINIGHCLTLEDYEQQIKELEELLELETDLTEKYRGKFHDKLEQIKELEAKNLGFITFADDQNKQITELKGKINKALEHSEEDIRSSLRVMLIIEALKK